MTHSEEPTTIESRIDTDAPLTISLDEAFAPHAPVWTPDLEAFDRELDFAFSFQRRLLELRHALGLTQAQAGEIAGEHQTEMSRMERGRFSPSFARGSRILSALESARASRAAAPVRGHVEAVSGDAGPIDLIHESLRLPVAWEHLASGHPDRVEASELQHLRAHRDDPMGRALIDSDGVQRAIPPRGPGSYAVARPCTVPRLMTVRSS